MIDSSFDAAFSDSPKRKTVERDGVKVVWNMPFSEYLAINAVNSSRLKLLKKSPAHYHANAQFSGTRSQSLGTLAHAMILEGDTVKERFMSPPEGMKRDKRTKKYQDFLATVPNGVEVVLASELAEARAISNHALSTCELFKVKGIETELTIIWTDETSGILCKARLDMWVPNVGEVDVKTCQDYSLDQFPWAAKRYGYFEQRAWYRRAILAAQSIGLLQDDRDDVEMHMLAIETGPVRAWQLYQIPDEEITHFDAVNAARLEIVRECTEKGEWPFTTGTIPLGCPGKLELQDDDETENSSLDWGD